MSISSKVRARYAIIPFAQANMAKIPDELNDEQVFLLADIASTGFSASESAQVKIGDSVAILAEGPIGLGVTAGAKLREQVRYLPSIHIRRNSSKP